MHHRNTQQALQPEIMNKLVLWIAGLCVLFLTPFAISNVFKGHIVIGAMALTLVVILATNAWRILTQGRYYPASLLFGLVPTAIFFLAVSIVKQGIIGVVWCYPAVLSLYLLLPERRAWAANAVLLLTVFPFMWLSFDNDLALRMIVTLIMISIFSAIFISVIYEQQRKLQGLANTDPLTGLLNRKQLQETLERAIRHRNRMHTAMSVATFDLDHFKRINDVHGHGAGDRVLCDVANLLSGRMRETDSVFRLGGEEFLVLFYGTDLIQSARIAETLRTQVTALNTIDDYTITTSIGITELQANDDWQSWMKRSDNNLYAAKANGRNQVIAQ